MKLKYISWIPAVLLIITIFLYSSKEAETSNDSSMNIAKKVLTLYEKLTNTQVQQQEKMQILDTINHIVRKTAHFCEYALLSISIAFHIFVIGNRKKWLFLLPVFISFLNASLDEIHQIFVPGRAGMVRDVLLDTAGAAAGSLFFYLFVLSLCKKRITRTKGPAKTD